MSKVWILLEFEFDSPVPQQLMLFIEAKTNSINNQQQQLFIPKPIPINITPDLVNTFGLILPIY